MNDRYNESHVYSTKQNGKRKELGIKKKIFWQNFIVLHDYQHHSELEHNKLTTSKN